MNFEALGAIAELLGAVGVIASLAYVARQINQNTRSIRASTEMSGLGAWNQVNAQISGNPELAELMRKGMGPYATLGPIELTRFNAVMMSAFNILETFHRQYEMGLLEADVWDAWGQTFLRQFVETPGVRAWIRGTSGLAIRTPSFRAHVERLLAERPAGETGPVA